jgi:hypothetical protein
MQTPSLTRSLWFHLPSRQPPTLLLTLLVLWFACMFAPIVCILHCHLLGSVLREHAAGHTHTHHLGSNTTSQASHAPVCHIIEAQPAQPAPSPELPPTATLPRVVNDVLLAVIALFLPLTAARARSESGTPRLSGQFSQPHTPPPKITPVARSA